METHTLAAIVTGLANTDFTWNSKNGTEHFRKLDPRFCPLLLIGSIRTLHWLLGWLVSCLVTRQVQVVLPSSKSIAAAAMFGSAKETKSAHISFLLHSRREQVSIRDGRAAASAAVAPVNDEELTG